MSKKLQFIIITPLLQKMKIGVMVAVHIEPFIL